MNVPVILLKGVTTDNPFLPLANGIDLSLPMLPVNIALGDNDLSDSEWFSVSTDGTLFSTAESPYPITEVQPTDETNAKSRILFSASASFFENQNQDNGVNHPAAGYIFLGATQGAGPGTEIGHLYIKNLDPAKFYNLILMARRDDDGTGPNREADYYVNGGLMQTIDARNNTTENNWSDIQPDSDGVITITINKNGRIGYGYASYIKISEA